MENNEQKIENFAEKYAHSVPKVSIDGRSHGHMLLVAIGSGAILAIIILIVLISLIKHKKKLPSQDEKSTGNFTLSTISSKSNISTPSQKSKLMFKYFGRSLSSFDIEKSYINSNCIALNIELDSKSNQIYRKQLLTPSSLILNEKYIQTVTC